MDDKELYFTITVCLKWGSDLFIQLLRVTGILFEVTLLIFLPLVDNLT